MPHVRVPPGPFQTYWTPEPGLIGAASERYENPPLHGAR